MLKKWQEKNRGDGIRAPKMHLHKEAGEFGELAKMAELSQNRWLIRFRSLAKDGEAIDG